ncbi:homing endonuclease associated repeat-containing protein [Haloferax prahovense]|uniref:homing endonuclease associated repeat-containing protein n=1 Tax=Haloferax prahovense TaxID=381852 RepID=UPI0009DF55D9|nr:helix-hairpin-helix domain-containing protein [Haloferax prahovense]
MSHSSHKPDTVAEHLASAQRQIASIDDELDSPSEVYCSILLAHNSLCGALRQLSTESNHELTDRKASQIRSDISALEKYAELLKADMRVLEKLFAPPDGSVSSLSESEIVQLQDFLTDIKEIPTVGNASDLSGESITQISSHVWHNLLNHEDTNPSRDEVLTYVEDLATRMDRVPSHEDVRNEGVRNLDIFYDYFDSWTDVIEASNIAHRSAFIRDLKAVGEKLGKRPTIAEHNVHGEYSPSRIQRAFGSWTDAVAASKIDPATDKELCEAIEELADELGRIPTARHMDDQGRFNSHMYAERFGSWVDAIEATELDYRTEVLDDLQAVAVKLGHLPTTTEMETHGVYSPNDVYKHFDSWDEAKEATQFEESDSSTKESSTTDESQNSSSVSPSELAERYEVFLQLSRTVNRLVEQTASETSESVMREWRDTLSKFILEGRAEWENGYGPQQADRSAININDYRAKYGDGEQVTEFQVIGVEPVDSVVSDILKSVLEWETVAVHRPVSPESMEPLPVFVESERELSYVTKLLAEFPAEPPVDQWEWPDREDIIDPRGSQEQTESSEVTPAQATTELCSVSGVEQREAEALFAAGFGSIEDLKTATVDNLVEVEGISQELVFRIKADVGGK